MLVNANSIYKYTSNSQATKAAKAYSLPLQNRTDREPQPMILSAKYILLYTGAGLVTGFIAKRNKTALLVGMGIAALIGASFSVSYAILSAIEFAVGFGITVMLQRNNKDEANRSNTE
jgi:hypothetical protein